LEGKPMADDENNEPKKKSGILKILGFAFGGLFLVGAGLGAGFFMFGTSTAEITDVLSRSIHWRVNLWQMMKITSPKRRVEF